MAGPGLNKVILIGNLGKDPEMKYTPSGVAVTTFSLATGDRYKDQSGEYKDKTEWHNIVVWRNLAEICNNYLKKGSKIYIEGRIQTRSWDDKDGIKKYITEIVARDMIMLDSKGGTGGANAGTGEPPLPSSPPDEQMTSDDLPF